MWIQLDTAKSDIRHSGHHVAQTITEHRERHIAMLIVFHHQLLPHAGPVLQVVPTGQRARESVDGTLHNLNGSGKVGQRALILGLDLIF